MRPSFANTYLTLRKPPPGPRFARPEDKLRGCLEGCSHGKREFFCTLLMAAADLFTSNFAGRDGGACCRFAADRQLSYAFR